MTVMKMLAEGYSYRLIGTLAGIHKQTVAEIARQTGRRRRRRKKVKPRKLSKKLVTDKTEKTLPVQKEGFSLWVRKEGKVHMPHHSQCKNIFSLDVNDNSRDYYCQNERILGQSYCAECHARNHNQIKIKD